MADQKFTLEEILSEYTPDGKRSGIQKADDRPLAHGKLETEKLLNAATSDRPMPSGSGGYRHVAEQPPQPEEELVDIKSTISHIKAAQSAQRAQEAAASPVMAGKRISRRHDVYSRERGFLCKRRQCKSGWQYLCRRRHLRL